MPILAVNATPEGALEGHEALSRSLSRLARTAPVIIMVHGYKYDPRSTLHSPHRHLFAATTMPRCGRVASWPAGLGVGEGGAEPLCIGFGWPARGSIWQVWRRSAKAARPLAGLISAIAAQGRRVHLLAHSMGARVCLQALTLAPAASVDRVILMTGAALRGEACAALAAPAARAAEIVNVTSRENDLFDALVEALMGFRDVSIGSGLGTEDRRWLDLQIDAAGTRRALATLGYPIAEPETLVSHWSAFTRPGLLHLYRGLLADRRLPLGVLRNHLPTPEARWTRVGAALSARLVPRRSATSA
ncbi:alpha/beta hydrolase [Palleronia sp.]|uniref:alpha/beta hydrolase n=1 Tax=Palleronia sp. TaxID=1940284 RepID=UPI0035C7A037